MKISFHYFHLVFQFKELAEKADEEKMFPAWVIAPVPKLSNKVHLYKVHLNIYIYIYIYIYDENVTKVRDSVELLCNSLNANIF